MYEARELNLESPFSADTGQQRSDGLYVSLIKRIDDLVLQKAQLEEYEIEEELSPLLDQIPLNDPEFRIVHADLSSLTYERQSKNVLLLSILTLAGLLIAILYILTQHALQQRRAEQSLSQVMGAYRKFNGCLPDHIRHV